jgi:hypothetical protein
MAFIGYLIGAERCIDPSGTIFFIYKNAVKKKVKAGMT